jgi:hypothetical protein
MSSPPGGYAFQVRVGSGIGAGILFEVTAGLSSADHVSSLRGVMRPSQWDRIGSEHPSERFGQSV